MKYRDYLNPVIAMMAVILLAAWMLNVSQVNAQSSHVIKEQLQKLEEEKQALEKELQDVNAQYRKNEDEIADLIAQKNVIEQEINLLNLQTVPRHGSTPMWRMAPILAVPLRFCAQVKLSWSAIPYCH